MIKNKNIENIIDSLTKKGLIELHYYNHQTHELLPTNKTVKDNAGSLEPCFLFGGSGKFSGSSIDTANRRYVTEQYPELISQKHILKCSTSDYYNHNFLVIFFLRSSVIESGLFDDLEKLTYCNKLSEELYVTIQEELLKKAWDDWLRDEFKLELEKRTGIEFINTDWQKSLFDEILWHGSGHEYYPRLVGESIQVDMNEVFRHSESIVKAIKREVSSLNNGNCKFVGLYKPIDKYYLGLEWSYCGSRELSERQTVIDLFKGYKEDILSDQILKDFGLKWYAKVELHWEVKKI